MEYLVSSLNNSLVRSEADISFNLKKLLPYDIDISNQTAEQILNVSTERAKIKQDQILYGADYHVIVSRWNIEKGTTLGLASLDTAIDSSDWDFWAENYPIGQQIQTGREWSVQCVFQIKYSPMNWDII